MNSVAHNWKGVATLVAGVAAAVALLLLLAQTAHADPATRVDVGDAASTTWGGSVAGAQLGGSSMDSVSDINGDGRADVVVSSSAAGEQGAYVLFTPKGGEKRVSDDLQPQNGYRLEFSQTLNFVGIGDQNGDHVPDMLAYNLVPPSFAAVVYGVADPSSLPECDPPSPARCLDVTDLDPANGYKLVGPSGSAISVVGDAGDVNGDGIDDLLVTDATGSSGSGSVYLVFGGRTAPANGDPVDMSTLPSSEAIEIDGPAGDAGATFGGADSGVGDLDGDGLGDIAISMGGFGTNPAMLYVFDGSALNTSPISVSDFGPEDGFRVQPNITQSLVAVNTGDLNGDGRPDLAMAGLAFALGTDGGSGALIYGPADNPTDPISSVSPTASQGYSVLPGDPNALFGGYVSHSVVASIGDLNGDGIPDQLFAGPGTTVDGNASAGAATVAFGERPTPSDPLTLGTDLTPDKGVAVVDQQPGASLGVQVSSAGDIDHDGLPDFFVSSAGATVDGVPGAGAVYTVLGKSLIGQATTGQAGAATSSGATLGGVVRSNGRASTAHFEWGASTSYGKTTADVDVDANHKNNPVATEISGLSPKTTYHYRLVTTNDLGLTEYGQDRSFTTPEKSGGSAGDACEADPTQAGCDGYCPAHPNAVGCKKGKASLGALVAAPKKSRVKRGKKATILATITSTGTKNVKGLKICVKAPKKKVKVKGGTCKKIGSLKPGKTATKSFKVKVKKKAKKGSKITLKFKAKTSNAGKRSAKAKIKVTGHKRHKKHRK